MALTDAVHVAPGIREDAVSTNDQLVQPGIALIPWQHVREALAHLFAYRLEELADVREAEALALHPSSPAHRSAIEAAARVDAALPEAGVRDHG